MLRAEKRAYHREVVGIGVALAVVLCDTAAATVPLPAPVASVEKYCLDNGVSVLLAQSSAAPVVAVQAWVGAGSADERAREVGGAHLVEHMLFKGTARRGVGRIAADIEEAGGEINAWTAFDQTVFHVVIESRFADRAVDVLADAISQSAFDADEVEREREVVLEEFREGQDEPSRILAHALFRAAFERHPYGRPVIGTEAAVAGLSRKSLLAYHDRWYRADNLTLVVVGDFKPAAMRKMLRSRFGVLASGGARRRRPKEPEQTAIRAVVNAMPVADGRLVLGIKAPPIEHPDMAALDVLAIILGQGDSSRLAQSVRRESELVTGAYSYVHSLRDISLFIIGAALRGNRFDETVEGVATELFRLTREVVSLRELHKAKRAIEADAIFQHETVEGYARSLGYYATMTSDADFEAGYLERIRNLTSAQVMDVAARYFDPQQMSLSAIVPEGVEAGTAARRKKIAGRLARLVTTAAKKSAKQTPRKGSSSPSVVREVLANGITVVIKRDKTVPIVSARAVWSGGLRRETRTNNGITNLLATTMTLGCGRRSSDEIIEIVDELAGAISGFSGRNSFGIRTEWLARDWDLGFDLFADCILEPRFEGQAFEREKRRLTDALRSREDSPNYVVFRAFTEALYQKHPYRFNVMGDEPVISKMGSQQIADYYDMYYRPSDMTLAVVGDVDPAQVISQARRRFGAQPKQQIAVVDPPQENFDGRPASKREVYRFMDRQQAQLVVGFPGTTITSEDRYAVEVLSTVLGGQGGRLFVSLRDEEALAYQLGAYSLEGIDPGYIAVHLSCSPDKIPQALEGIRRELERMVASPISKNELNRAIRSLSGAHSTALQRRSSIAAALAFYEAYGLGYQRFLDYPRELQKLSARDVQRVAAKYFDWERAITATVMPELLSPGAQKRARGVKRRLPGKRRGR